MCCNDLVSHTNALLENLIPIGHVKSLSLSLIKFMVIDSVDCMLVGGAGMFVDMNYDTFGGIDLANVIIL